jgi:1,4-alpha-glucan branching enzyme
VTELFSEADDEVYGAPREGMGAIPHDQGTTFRVWAPHADAMSVLGSMSTSITSTARRRWWRFTAGRREAAVTT